MLYDDLALVYLQIEDQSKRTAMTETLVNLFNQCTENEIDKVIYLTQGMLYPEYSNKSRFGLAESMVIDAIHNATQYGKMNLIKKSKELGDAGLLAEFAIKEKKVIPLFKEDLSINSVHEKLVKIVNYSGTGSNQNKVKLLSGILSSISPLGARYLVRTIMGSLRLGIGDMTILDALSVSFLGSKKYRSELKRGYDLTSDLGYVAKYVMMYGKDVIGKFHVELGRPIRTMSAQKLSTAEEIVNKLESQCVAEYKLDGERFQIHKSGDAVTIFSRKQKDITDMFPDAVDLIVNNISAEKAIIEGEAVVVDFKSNTLLPFQVLMQRKRKYDITSKQIELPISLFLFDCLYVNGYDLTETKYPLRRSQLEQIVNETDRISLVKQEPVCNVEDIDDFFEEAINVGTEGLVVKSTSDDSIYSAGARSWLWVKLKKSYQSKLADSIDLVVVGADYGKGKRTGFYGNLLLAAYDPLTDTYKTICRVGTGFTDLDLQTMKERLHPHLRERMHPSKSPKVDSSVNADVWFDPRQVVEVLGDELTISPLHTAAWNILGKDAGLALRFPRFIRWRDDKSAEEATSVSELIDMYNEQLKSV